MEDEDFKEIDEIVIRIVIIFFTAGLVVGYAVCNFLTTI